MSPARLPRTADRLATGSTLLARRLAARTAAWVRAGRRHDLQGWRAALGPIVRLAVLAGATYLAARIVRAVPALLWPLTAAWTVAAWRTAPAPAKHQAEVSEDARDETPPEPDPIAVRQLLTDLIADCAGVHLSTVLEHLPASPGGAPREVGQLRAQLAALGVPVRRSVKVHGRVAYGVHRDDLPAPSPAAERADAA